MAAVCSISTAKLAYRLCGSPEKPLVIVEAALTSCSAEWWQLVEPWSREFCVLAYDRAGYGQSTVSSLPRSPENIAKELKELVDSLDLKTPAILIGHSMGGLYVQQYTRLFPDRVRGIILLDPVSAKNYQFESRMSRSEYAQSGFDKRPNLNAGLLATRLHLGFLLRPLLKKGVPFYYLKTMPKEEESYILDHLTRAETYQTALAEYSYIASTRQLASLENPDCFPAVPLILICHSHEVMAREIEQFGRADHATAMKLDELWLSVMQEYLTFSSQSTYLQSEKSSHYIHLSDPEIVCQALRTLTAAGRTPVS